MTNFKTALKFMKMGLKVKRHQWEKGYWQMSGDEVMICDENNKFINLREANNIYGILLNITSDDWEIALENNKKYDNTDWDGDKKPKCDKPYSKNKNLNQKPVTYDSLMNEIKADFNITEEDAKQFDKEYEVKFSTHKPLSRMDKKYNPKRGKRAENGAVDETPKEVKDSELSRLERKLKERIDALNAKNEHLNNSYKHEPTSFEERKLREELKAKHKKEYEDYLNKKSFDNNIKVKVPKSECPRVAPDVKPTSNEDFDYLYKLFECLYKDGTLEKITQDTIEQMTQDLLSVKKVLQDIIDKNKQK